VQLYTYACVITHGWTLARLFHSLFSNLFSVLVIVELAFTITSCTCCYYSYFSGYNNEMKIVCCVSSGMLSLIARARGMNDLGVVILDVLAFTFQIIHFISKFVLF